MNKRPREIEDAIDIIDNMMFEISNSTEAWNKVLKYIEKLEKSEQEMLNEMERMSDDGK